MLRFAVRCVRGGQSRREALFELLRPEGVFQPFATTAPNRYPGIFRFVRDTVGDGPDIRILSFGCASGEEVFSLRDYFASAAIVGIDANPFNIAACRRRARRKGMSDLVFRTATVMDGEADASYDAIFCMAVLRHGGLKATDTTCSHLIRFAEGERLLDSLARCLKPGGLLAVMHSNFRICDTRTSRQFTPVLRVDPALLPATPLFGPGDLRLDSDLYGEVVFRKDRAGGQPASM
ncbi:class I SAM-dependent methyltransferase [Azospirillum thermophilum]|uniref:class I SAM-dependent methyltransferase n=1 Tax=Azospirillum thermophilum TaxID=2202148 RepID=UPI00143DE6CB|nr:class I SAM-dependent methyltransferase [Azospirillum thermophilum]